MPLSSCSRATLEPLLYRCRTTLVPLSSTLVPLSYHCPTTLIPLANHSRTTLLPLSHQSRATLVLLSYDAVTEVGGSTLTSLTKAAAPHREPHQTTPDRILATGAVHFLIAIGRFLESVSHSECSTRCSWLNGTHPQTGAISPSDSPGGLVRCHTYPQAYPLAGSFLPPGGFIRRPSSPAATAKRAGGLQRSELAGIQSLESCAHANLRPMLVGSDCGTKI